MSLDATMVVFDAYDEVFAFGRSGHERVRVYLDDLEPDTVLAIRDKVATHESVLALVDDGLVSVEVDA